MSVNSACVEGRARRVWDRDENTEKRSSFFVCVFDFSVKNEAIENVDFKFFSGGDALA